MPFWSRRRNGLIENAGAVDLWMKGGREEQATGRSGFIKDKTYEHSNYLPEKDVARKILDGRMILGNDVLTRSEPMANLEDGLWSKNKLSFRKGFPLAG